MKKKKASELKQRKFQMVVNDGFLDTVDQIATVIQAQWLMPVTRSMVIRDAVMRYAEKVLKEQ